jgi:lysophospholipase L1-like esterase
LLDYPGATLPKIIHGYIPSKALRKIGLGLLVLLAALLLFLAVRPDSAAVTTRTAPGLQTPAEVPAKAVGADPVVAFLGDSYTAGVGASPGRTWPELLASNLAWDSYKSFAHGGTGYATTVTKNAMRICGLDQCPSYIEALPRVIDYAPNLVIVAGGRNDTRKSVDEVEAGAKELLESLSRELPEATVVVTSPIWDARQRPAKLDQLTEVIRRAAEETNATYLDLGEPFAGKPELITSDHVHPNDAGYQLLAHLVAKGLVEAGITGGDRQ